MISHVHRRDLRVSATMSNISSSNDSLTFSAEKSSHVRRSTFDTANHPAYTFVLSHTPSSHSGDSGLTQSASGTCSWSLVLLWSWSSGAMSLWRFAFLIFPLTNWAAAELNHPKPGQRAERGDDLALACMPCPG